MAVSRAGVGYLKAFSKVWSVRTGPRPQPEGSIHMDPRPFFVGCRNQGLVVVECARVDLTRLGDHHLGAVRAGQCCREGILEHSALGIGRDPLDPVLPEPEELEG